MVPEMNISTEQGQLTWSTVYPIAGTVWTTMASPTVYPVAAGQLGIQLLSNWLASNWHRVNNYGQSNCLSSSCRPVGNPAAVKLASQ
jgi:hypothetical protein